MGSCAPPPNLVPPLGAPHTYSSNRLTPLLAVSRELHPGAVPGHSGRAAGLEKGGLAERPLDRDGARPPEEPSPWRVELEEPAGRRGGGCGKVFRSKFPRSCWWIFFWSTHACVCTLVERV